MGHYCVAFNCQSKSALGNKSLQFHRFPHNQPEVLKKWIHAIHRENWQPTKYSRLCSKHFSDEDYQIRPGAEVRWLTKDAIPTIFDHPEHLKKPIKKRRLLIRNTDPHVGASTSKNDIVSTLNICHENIFSQDSTTNEVAMALLPSEKQESVSSEVPVMFPSFVRQEDATTEMPTIPSSSSVPTTSQMQSPTKLALRRKIRLLQAKLRRRDQKITSMSDLITALKKKCNTEENLISILENNFSGFSLDLFKNQIKNQKKPSSGRRYTTTFKEFALTVYFYSPKAYRYIRQLINLPHPSLIKSWLSAVNCEPGLIKEVFDFLKVAVVKKSHLKNCALIFDSMAIRKQLIWSTKLGKYTGFIDYAGIVDENSENLATEALVFQIVSLTGNFKCPIGYFLIDKIYSNVQAEIVKMCLCKLEEVGVRVHSVTCDGTITNIKTLKILGCQFSENGVLSCSFDHPMSSAKTKVFAFLDPCHMLKLARNAISQKGFISSPSGIIKWNFIVKLNNLQLKEGLKLANALSSAHINYANKKMNVKLAAQTLSSGVADALFYLNKIQHIDFQDCEATILFIRTIDKIFDFLNSRNPFQTGFKQALRLKNRSYWESVFSEAINYLSSLYIDGVHIFKHERKTFALGFILCMKSTQELALRLLLEMESPLSYFLTYKFSQDHIELLFSCIRSRGGCNNNPNTDQFKWALRKLLFRNCVTPGLNGNCVAFEPEAQCSILNFRSPKRSLQEDNEDSSDSDIDKYLRIIDCQSLTDFVDNILYYIAGYICRKIIKKLSCTECHNMLLTPDSTDHIYTAEQYSYQAFTKHITQGGLIFASPAVYGIVHYTERTFRLLIVQQKLSLKKNFSILIVNCVVKHFSQSEVFKKLNFQHRVDSELGCEELHSMQMVRTISKIYCELRLFHHAKKLTLQTNSNAATIRHKLNKIVLFKHV